MKVCPQCGFRHLDADERCIRCGAYLDDIGLGARRREGDAPAPRRERFQFTGSERPGWRPRLPGLAEAWARRRWFFLRRALSSELPEGVHHRNPWVAAWLSVFPGLGQLYNRQPKKAALIFLWVAAWLGLAWATLYESYSNYILLGLLAAAVYGFHDGLVTAKRINREYFVWQHGVAFYAAWVFFICFFCLAFQYIAAYGLVQFRAIAHGELAPILYQGDRVVVDMLTRPKVGDVVLYDPRPLRMTRRGEIESLRSTLDPSSMIERIVAGPGETIERRDGIYYRNGRELALEEEPLVSGYLPLNLKLTAPAGHYIILFSYAFGTDWLTGAEGPRLNAPGWEMENWDEVCCVAPGEITGRVRCVYQPPAHRRWVR